MLGLYPRYRLGLSLGLHRWTIPINVAPQTQGNESSRPNLGNMSANFKR